jgi:hypothetical protein
MPIDVTLTTQRGHNSVLGNTSDVGAVASGDYALIRIELPSVVQAAASVLTANPVVWDLEIIPLDATGVPYHCSHFAFVLAPTGQAIAITFRLYNDGGGNGGYRVKVIRPLSPVR